MNPGEPVEQIPGADRYLTAAGVYDEMWTGEEVQPHWAYFMESLQRLGYPEMERRREEVDLRRIVDADPLRAMQAAVERVTVDE